MNGMFAGCSSLISLPDLSKWNTEKVTYIHGMFYKCNSLISLPNLYKWNTNNVEDISEMLEGCFNTLIKIKLNNEK